LWKAVGYLR